MAIATSASRKVFNHQVQSTGLARYFKVTVCAHEAKPKPDPSMLYHIMDLYSVSAKETLMIGDTHFDIKMADAAQIDSLWVSYGNGKCAPFMEEKKMVEIQSINDLLSLVS